MPEDGKSTEQISIVCEEIGIEKEVNIARNMISSKASFPVVTSVARES